MCIGRLIVYVMHSLERIILVPHWLDPLDLPDEYASVVKNIPSELKGSEFVLAGYNWYQSNYNTSAPRQRAKNGKVFEGLILDTLYQVGIHPAYYQATFRLIPHVVYDILLYHPKNPVILSCKTSLRERWKQADLEGLALKQVYRAARSYLLTLSSEGHRVQRIVESSDALGLDGCLVIASSGDGFDRLLHDLRTISFVEANPILPVSGKVMRGENAPHVV